MIEEHALYLPTGARTPPGTETLRHLCGTLIEQVGKGVYHRRTHHGGRFVSNCLTCRGGREAELAVVRQISKLIEGD